MKRETMINLLENNTVKGNHAIITNKANHKSKYYYIYLRYIEDLNALIIYSIDGSFDILDVTNIKKIEFME